MAWERLKTRVRSELAVLMEVAAWREQEAQSRDVPRSRVLKDDAVGDIATHAPTSLERLANLRSLPKGFDRSKWGADIVAAVQRGLARDLASLPKIEKPRSNSNGAAIVELLKVLLRMTSERHAVASKIIATVGDLEEIADDNADVRLTAGAVSCSARRRWRSSMASSRSPSKKAGWSGSIETRALSALIESEPGVSSGHTEITALASIRSALPTMPAKLPITLTTASL
jgi:ribonuclease D